MGPTRRTRSAPPPRTVASGWRSRTRSSYTTRCWSRRRSISRDPPANAGRCWSDGVALSEAPSRSHLDLVDRHFAPPGLLQRGLATGVSNAQGADEHPALLFRQHGVPHRRGVARPLDCMPRANGPVVLVDEARVGELVPRCNAPVLVIDPEDRHRIAA